MNLNESPVISQPSLLHPTVTIVGNREITPSTTQWLRLFLLPTNPLNALVVSQQWLWVAYGSTWVALISPLAVQVCIGVIWVFLGGCLGVLVAKEPRAKIDAIWVLFSCLLGVVLCL